MDKEIITFGCTEVKTRKFHRHKRHTSNYDLKKYNEIWDKVSKIIGKKIP